MVSRSVGSAYHTHNLSMPEPASFGHVLATYCNLNEAR